MVMKENRVLKDQMDKRYGNEMVHQVSPVYLQSSRTRSPLQPSGEASPTVDQ